MKRQLSLLKSSLICAVSLTLNSVAQTEKPQLSGIYPHLAMFNVDGECGTGAVVPWAE